MFKDYYFIPVIFAADDNYFFPLYISILSLLKTANKNVAYDIRILHPSCFSEINRNSILKLVSIYQHCTATFYNMQDTYKETKLSISHITTPTYYRLSLPSIMNDLDKCIYLDVDIIVKQNLADLFNVNIEQYYIAGVRAPDYLYPNIDYTLNELNIPNLDKYVNAGVLLINLQKMRKDNLEQQFNELLPLNYSSQDQHIINKACYPNIYIIPPIFNAMTKYDLLDDNIYDSRKDLQLAYSKTEWDIARQNPSIIHYADSKKPWFDFSVPYAKDWWNMAFSSDYALDIFTYYYNKIFENASDKKKVIYALKQDIINISESITYRLGKFLLYIPSLIKHHNDKKL